MKIQKRCLSCGGKGVLPPLGFAGLPPDAPERRDVKRNFERSCSICDGSGWLWTEVSVPERDVTQAIVLRQLFGLPASTFDLEELKKQR